MEKSQCWEDQKLLDLGMTFLAARWGGGVPKMTNWWVFLQDWGFPPGMLRTKFVGFGVPPGKGFFFFFYVGWQRWLFSIRTRIPQDCDWIFRGPKVYCRLQKTPIRGGGRPRKEFFFFFNFDFWIGMMLKITLMVLPYLMNHVTKLSLYRPPPRLGALVSFALVEIEVKLYL